MRIFFALWPPPATARALAQWAGEAQGLTGGKATEQANIHLTLAFLGNADPARALRAARRVCASAHRLPLEEARYWRENRIVWAGPKAVPTGLNGLAEKLGIELYREEFMLERRPFAAHVTLIRGARPARLPPLPAALDWPVNEFQLMRSSLSSAGASYEPLAFFPLSASG